MMTPKQLKAEVKALRAHTTAILTSKTKARNWLYKHGFITKTGRLTKYYKNQKGIFLGDNK